MPNYQYPYYSQFAQQPQIPIQMQAQAQQQAQQQIQSGGFMPAPNEAYALNYPIAPGNSMTFKIEGKPIVIEKSMGFSQLESPKIDRYRLVKEEVAEGSNLTKDEPLDLEPINSTLDDLKGQIEQIWGEIDGLKKKPAPKPKKKEAEDDTE